MRQKIYAALAIAILTGCIWIVGYIGNVADIPDWEKFCSVLTTMIVGGSLVGWCITKSGFEEN